MPRKHIPHSIGIKRKARCNRVTCEDIRSPVMIRWCFWKVEDLPDINTLYEPRELAQLFVGNLGEFVESCDFMGSRC